MAAHDHAAREVALTRWPHNDHKARVELCAGPPEGLAQGGRAAAHKEARAAVQEDQVAGSTLGTARPRALQQARGVRHLGEAARARVAPRGHVPQGGQLGKERVGAEPAGPAAAPAKLVLFLVLGGQVLSLDEGVAFSPHF